ncbi:MAG: PIN domain-containing protein, partial [Limnohabitans sp.]
MPLPPAPTQRASRLTSKAFEPNAELADEIASAPAAETSREPASLTAKPRHKAQPSKSSALTRTTAYSPAPQAASTTPPASKSAAKPAGKKRHNGPRKLFVLDTNVLMHDPMSLFRFEEHDVFLPMIVLEELDGHKKGMTEVARNARQTSRSLDALAAAQGFDMTQGLPLNTTGYSDALGKLFFQTEALDLSLPLALPQGKADN